MKIWSIEATDMGNNQDEIANWIEEHLSDRDFNDEEEFFNMEGDLITKACKALKWSSVPQQGGLIVNWDK